MKYSLAFDDRRKRAEISFSLRLEDNAASFVGGRWVCGFPILRDLGANLRHEKLGEGPEEAPFTMSMEKFTAAWQARIVSRFR